MDLKKIIGYNIYSLRMKYKLSQEEFAKKLTPYCSRTNLGKIENGQTIPSAEFIKSVCIAFNLSADWLLDINNNTNTEPPQNVFLSKFNNLDKEAQQTILTLIDIILKNAN